MRIVRITFCIYDFGCEICWIRDHFQNEKFQSAPGSRVGTPAYLAPEVILTTTGKKYDGKVKSCACIVSGEKCTE